MSANANIEQRLEAVEMELARLREAIETPSSKKSWIDQIAGSMAEYPEFDEVVEYGRQFRASQKDAEEAVE